MYRSLGNLCRLFQVVAVILLGKAIELIHPTTWGELPEGQRRKQELMLCPDCCGRDYRCVVCHGYGEVCIRCRRSLDQCLCLPDGH